MTGRTRRGVRTTAVVTAAMAALTASQGPGATVATAGQQPAPLPPGPSVSGDSPYRTELPPLRTSPGVAAGAVEAAPGAAAGAAAGAVPATVFAAYRAAETALADSAPGCGLRRELLAAIGQVESGQARGGRVTADGTARPPILGPRLDGDGFALIRDSDGGMYDGDTGYDRAVGPMQFIPATWAAWGADGNGDGRADPQNVFDAALAAGRYLCAGGRNLAEPGDLERAVLGYNHSTAYLRTVLAWYAYYLGGHRVVPDHGGPYAERPAPAPTVEPEPEPARTARPRPAASTSPSPSPAASPSASPRPTGAPAEEPGPPSVPAVPSVPLPDVELPGPGGLTSNGTDSMAAAPSTSPDTGR